MSFFLVFAQYFTVEGLACTSAVLAGLISTLGIPLTLAVTALFFRDERQLFGSWTFKLGLLLALGGALCMPLLQHGLNGAATRGAWYLILSAVIVALVTVWIKKMLQDIHPLSLAAVNCGFTCVFFLPAGLFWGDLSRIVHVPAVPTLVLFFSGAFGLVVGGWLAMVCIQKAGVSITRLAELATPVIIGLLGYWLFREALTIPELVSGVVVMAGCGLVLMRNNTGIPGPSSHTPAVT
jgi:O-acetylserine/cysteine efflux transporter